MNSIHTEVKLTPEMQQLPHSRVRVVTQWRVSRWTSSILDSSLLRPGTHCTCHFVVVAVAAAAAPRVLPHPFAVVTIMALRSLLLQALCLLMLW